jgi:hypothetical protein
LLGERPERRADVIPGKVKFRQRPLYPHEKSIGLIVDVLVCVDNIPVMLKDKLRHGRREAHAIGTGNQ